MAREGLDHLGGLLEHLKKTKDARNGSENNISDTWLRPLDSMVWT